MIRYVYREEHVDLLVKIIGLPTVPVGICATRISFESGITGILRLPTVNRKANFNDMKRFYSV